MAKKKFPKRKRPFNLLTEEGKEVANIHRKLVTVFPNKQDRLNYVRSLIQDFDRQIASEPESCFSTSMVI
jgi:hypothetical protein